MLLVALNHIFKLSAFVFSGVLISSCGQGSTTLVDPPTSATAVNPLTIMPLPAFQLMLSAEVPVSGLQWSSQDALFEQLYTQLKENAGVLFAAQVTVLSRPYESSRENKQRQWIAYAPNSHGVSAGVFFEKSAASIDDLAVFHSVSCADYWGNPVACTLRWQPK